MNCLVGLVQLGYCIKSKKILEIGDLIRKVIWRRKDVCPSWSKWLIHKRIGVVAVPHLYSYRAK
jgi:hypothetical protein